MIVQLSGAAVIAILAVGYFGINSIVKGIEQLVKPKKEQDTKDRDI